MLRVGSPLSLSLDLGLGDRCPHLPHDANGVFTDSLRGEILIPLIVESRPYSLSHTGDKSCCRRKLADDILQSVHQSGINGWLSVAGLSRLN